MKKPLIILTALILCLQSCIPSLHPLYTKKDLIKESRLVGEWLGFESAEKVSANEKWTIHWDERVEQYNLQHEMDGETAKFYLNYFKIGDQFYFDFYPTEPIAELKGGNTAVNDFYALHQFPVHTFAKVVFDGNEIKVHRFDMDWLEKLFQQRKVRIKHERVNDRYLLTASTRDLQAFVQKYANEKEAFIEPLTLKKAQ